MAKVSVKLLGRVKEVTGANGIEISIREGDMVKMLLNRLNQRFGETFRKFLYDPETNNLRTLIVIVVNGVNVMTREGLETKLRDNDLVFITTPIAGG